VALKPEAAGEGGGAVTNFSGVDAFSSPAIQPPLRLPMRAHNRGGSRPKEQDAHECRNIDRLPEHNVRLQVSNAVQDFRIARPRRYRHTHPRCETADMLQQFHAIAVRQHQVEDQASRTLADIEVHRRWRDT
jgi:hypothetical protein